MKTKQEEYYEAICQSSDVIDMQKYIKEVLALRIEDYPQQTAQDTLMLLTEEVGELAKAIRKSATSITIDRSKLEHYDTVENEAADVLIVLLSLCNILGIDLYRAFLEKEKINIKREWS